MPRRSSAAEAKAEADIAAEAWGDNGEANAGHIDADAELARTLQEEFHAEAVQSLLVAAATMYQPPGASMYRGHQAREPEHHHYGGGGQINVDDMSYEELLELGERCAPSSACWT